VKRNAGTMKLPPVTGRDSGDISPIFSRMEVGRVEKVEIFLQYLVEWR